ncbi:GNAT family N-acetyltransferase [Streptomyces europaeiscabiei]|uniref:GNAT family N-acetyltransferase n=1 Tax=Streptomyces europaeiscabiei TaxID=146819 RepID=UPI0029A88E74|nr:GNAT family N-acetyltransferase [Streptomyces europaeiscabiei]MDX3695654.1 GNAT family N-acetyltransferase [Streptomyces europaeiscabiei]
MDQDDLGFVVTEHLSHFPDGFFARPGPRFLRAHTATYRSGAHARAYIAEVDRIPFGLLVGVTDPAAHREHVVRGHGWKLTLLACAGLAVRPRLALHFIRTRLGRYAGKLLPQRSGRNSSTEQAPSPGGSDGTTAVLTHVAVIGRVRSLGLGTALVQRFADDATAAGCARVSLVTAAGPGGAGGYYERLGRRRTGETLTPEGRSFLTYEYPLTQGTAQ